MFDIIKWAAPLLSLAAAILGMTLGSWFWTASGLLFLATCLWFRLAVAQANMPARRWSVLFGVPLLLTFSAGTVLAFWGMGSTAGVAAASYLAGLGTTVVARLLRR